MRTRLLLPVFLAAGACAQVPSDIAQTKAEKRTGEYPWHFSVVNKSTTKPIIHMFLAFPGGELAGEGIEQKPIEPGGEWSHDYAAVPVLAAVILDGGYVYGNTPGDMISKTLASIGAMAQDWRKWRDLAMADSLDDWLRAALAALPPQHDDPEKVVRRIVASEVANSAELIQARLKNGSDPAQELSDLRKLLADRAEFYGRNAKGRAL